MEPLSETIVSIVADLHNEIMSAGRDSLVGDELCRALLDELTARYATAVPLGH
jgi:hypothetical protein